MAEHLIPREEYTKLEIISTHGSLYLTGWNRDDIRIKDYSDKDLVEKNKKQINLSFKGDAVIHIPHSLITNVKEVGRDAIIRGLTGHLDIKSIGGDLRLIDSKSAEIGSVGGDSIAKRIKGDLRIKNTGGDLRLIDSESAEIGSVSGDSIAKRIKGDLIIENTGGDLRLIDVGSAKLGSIGGDSIANSIQGDLRIENIGGDGLIDNVKGQVSLSSVGGDVWMVKVAGGIEAIAGGDVRLSFHPVPWQAYRVVTGGDISASIPDDSSADLSIKSGDKDIHVIIGDLDLRLEEKKLEQLIGEGGPTIILAAGGSVYLTGEDHTWLSNIDINFAELEELAVGFSAQTTERIKDHLGHLEDDLLVSLSGLSESLDSIDISEENLAKIATQIEESSRHAAHKAEIAAVKAQAKVEKKITLARKKALKAVKKHKNFDLEEYLADKQKKKTVSPDERILILKMLQDNKISPEEAGDLLEALEGR